MFAAVAEDCGTALGGAFWPNSFLNMVVVIEVVLRKEFWDGQVRHSTFWVCAKLGRGRYVGAQLQPLIAIAEDDRCIRMSAVMIM